MSTPWWPGTLRAPAARLIHPSRLESWATPIASHASFPNLVWIARISQGCRAEPSSHLHSRDATVQSRRRWFSRLRMRDGQVPCLRTRPNNASARHWSSPTWRPTTSSARSFRPCSRHPHHRRGSRSSAPQCGSFIPPASRACAGMRRRCAARARPNPSSNAVGVRGQRRASASRRGRRSLRSDRELDARSTARRGTLLQHRGARRLQSRSPKLPAVTPRRSAMTRPFDPLGYGVSRSGVLGHPGASFSRTAPRPPTTRTRRALESQHEQRADITEERTYYSRPNVSRSTGNVGP